VNIRGGLRVSSQRIGNGKGKEEEKRGNGFLCIRMV
jgi:hypothetical protein